MKKDRSGSENIFICPECGFAYTEKEWARKCQEWCSKYKSCNLDIAKHAVKKTRSSP